MITEKLTPLQLPINPDTPEIYRTRNGRKIIKISSGSSYRGYPLRAHVEGHGVDIFTLDGFFYSGRHEDDLDITHQLADQETLNSSDKEARRSDSDIYSGVVNRNWLPTLRKILLKAQAYYTGKPYSTLAELEKSCLKMLHDNDRLYNEALRPKMDKAEAAPPKFVVGELYEDKKKRVSRFIGNSSVYGVWEEVSPISTTTNAVFLRHHNGKDFTTKSRDIWRKHVPTPKRHTVDFWINFFNEQTVPNRIVYFSKKEADAYGDKRIACLHFTRTFTEGEGL